MDTRRERGLSEESGRVAEVRATSVPHDHQPQQGGTRREGEWTVPETQKPLQFAPRCEQKVRGNFLGWNTVAIIDLAEFIYPHLGLSSLVSWKISSPPFQTQEWIKAGYCGHHFSCHCIPLHNWLCTVAWCETVAYCTQHISVCIHLA